MKQNSWLAEAPGAEALFARPPLANIEGHHEQGET